MSETLGSLCDKLTIVKLKEWHSSDADRLVSLEQQAKSLKEEIDAFVMSAMSGHIPLTKLSFAANKVYKQSGNFVSEVIGSIGCVIEKLANVNCELWHEQEKVYDFEAVPNSEKNAVVKALAVLNLERNQCIDAIDRQLRELVSAKLSQNPEAVQ